MSQRSSESVRPRLARVRRRSLVAVLFVITLAVGTLAYGPDRPIAHAARGANPMTALIRDGSAAPLQGTVVERIKAGGYTYLALSTPEQRDRRWVVTLGRGEPLGAEVKVRSFGRRLQFYSRRLDRTFPELTFGIVSTTAPTEKP
ncbi:MAG TPA: hypothetical protein VFZ61_25485 [Polyangiales bacterium]